MKRGTNICLKFNTDLNLSIHQPIESSSSYAIVFQFLCLFLIIVSFITIAYSMKNNNQNNTEILKRFVSEIGKIVISAADIMT